jgi:hypothetical protein
MRKVILSLAAAGAALAVGSPAAAQYYPQSPYGYGGYGGYGYQRGGDPSDYFRRLYNVRRTIANLQYQRPYGLEAEARTLEQQLRVAARGGLDPREEQYFGRRVYNLEVRLNQVVNASRYGGYNGYGYNGYNGYNGYSSDRNRDRDDDGRWRRDRDDDRDDD